MFLLFQILVEILLLLLLVICSHCLLDHLVGVVVFQYLGKRELVVEQHTIYHGVLCVDFGFLLPLPCLLLHKLFNFFGCPLWCFRLVGFDLWGLLKLHIL